MRFPVCAISWPTFTWPPVVGAPTGNVHRQLRVCVREHRPTYPPLPRHGTRRMPTVPKKCRRHRRRATSHYGPIGLQLTSDAYSGRSISGYLPLPNKSLIAWRSKLVGPVTWSNSWARWAAMAHGMKIWPAYSRYLGGARTTTGRNTGDTQQSRYDPGCGHHGLRRTYEAQAWI